MRRILVVALVALVACGGDDADVASDDVTTSTTAASTTTVADEPAVEAATAYVEEELRWEVTDVEPGTIPGELVVSAESIGLTARVVVEEREAECIVTGMHVEGARTDETASVSIGHRDPPGRLDSVIVPWEDQPPDVTAELTLRYGDRVHTQTEDTGDFTFDLGFVPDEEGFLQVIWRDPNGTAVEGWATTIPAGPFAAG